MPYFLDLSFRSIGVRYRFRWALNTSVLPLPHQKVPSVDRTALALTDSLKVAKDEGFIFDNRGVGRSSELKTAKGRYHAWIKKIPCIENLVAIEQIGRPMKTVRS